MRNEPATYCRGTNFRHCKQCHFNFTHISTSTSCVVMSNRVPTSVVDSWLAEGRSDLEKLVAIRTLRGIPAPRPVAIRAPRRNSFFDVVEMKLRELLTGRSHYTPNRSAVKQAVRDLIEYATENNGLESDEIADGLSALIGTRRTDDWFLQQSGHNHVFRELLVLIRNEARQTDYDISGDGGADPPDAVSYDLADHPSDPEDGDDDDEWGNSHIADLVVPDDDDNDDDEILLAPAAHAPAAAPVRTPSGEIWYHRYMSDALELARRIREGRGGFNSAEFMRQQRERRTQDLLPPRSLRRAEEEQMGFDPDEAQLQGRINMRGSAAEEALRRIGATSS
jgi:hypothetical protein